MAASTTDPVVPEEAPFGEVTASLDITAVAYTGATEGVIDQPAGFAAHATNTSRRARPRPRPRGVFSHGPHAVFHATARKHVPALESHPYEAVKTYVDGTTHALEAACTVAVEYSIPILSK